MENREREREQKKPPQPIIRINFSNELSRNTRNGHESHRLDVNDRLYECIDIPSRLGSYNCFFLFLLLLWIKTKIHREHKYTKSSYVYAFSFGCGFNSLFWLAFAVRCLLFYWFRNYYYYYYYLQKFCVYIYKMISKLFNIHTINLFLSRLLCLHFCILYSSLSLSLRFFPLYISEHNQF